MTKIIECIPNFSEGIRTEIIEKLVTAAKAVPGVTLLDYSGDASHNRSVFTLVGDEDGIKTAAFNLAKCAVENIDLTKHVGEHPRMGAVDVIPFVPIKGATMEDCIGISKEVGEKIATELNLPVFLYEESAATEKRKNLAAIRKGQFEGMAKKMAGSLWKPDYGDAVPHPTAGVVAVGARMPLVAFNVNLGTSDIKIADSIAKIVRGSSGGLKHCKGIGIMLEDRNIAQVSMNIVNFEGAPLYRVVEMIRFEAARYGVNIIGSELIGLAPMKALIDSAEYYLQLEEFDYDKQVLENHIL